MKMCLVYNVFGRFDIINNKYNILIKEMEVAGGGSNKFYVFLSEFIGTAMLMICMNWSNTSNSGPMAVGACVFVMA